MNSKISFELLGMIVKYAKDHAEESLSHYERRNQSKEKFFDQILNGKIAEFCAYFYLLEANRQPTIPDISVYKQNNKSYFCDIVVDSNVFLHVKSITKDSFNRFGISFLVEKNDPIVVNPKKNHYFVIMIQDSFLEYKVYSFINSLNITWKSPKSSKLTTKLAFYLE